MGNPACPGCRELSKQVAELAARFAELTRKPDDVSEPVACVACRGLIPAGANTCPHCGWSYTAPEVSPGRTA